MVLDFDELIFVWLHCKLYINVLLKFLSAINLIENKFVVKCVTNYLLEVVPEWLEILVHLEDILLTVDDVHKLGVVDLLLHSEVDRLHFSMLLFHLLLLFKDLTHNASFVLLLFVVLVPEFTFNSVHLATGELKELLGSDGLLLVEVASQLKLFLDVTKGVLDVVHVILHLLNLLLSEVLQHLNVVLGPTMVLKAFCTQGLCVTQAIIDVIVLVFGADIVVPNDSAVVGHGASD